MRYDFKDIKINVSGNEYTITESNGNLYFGTLDAFKFTIGDVTEKYFGFLIYSGIKIYEAEIKLGNITVISFRSTSREQLLKDVINYIETCKA